MIDIITTFADSVWWNFWLRSSGVILMLWMLRKAVTVGRLKPGVRKRLSKFLPLADAIGIVLIVIWLGSLLFLDQSAYRTFFLALIFVFVLWLARVSLFDIVAGMILRFENSFQIGDTLIVKEGSGTISEVRLRCLDVTLDKGRQVSIPYSRLSSEVLVKPTSIRPVKTHQFELTLPKSGDISESTLRLISTIMNQPWSIVAIKPLVEPVGEQDGRFLFRITIHALELEHLAEIERAVRDAYIIEG